MPEEARWLAAYFPPEMWDAYDLICELTYVGDAKETQEGVNGGRRYAQSQRWFIKDARAFRLKIAVDRFLTKTAASLQRWQQESGRSGEARSEGDRIVGVRGAPQKRNAVNG